MRDSPIIMVQKSSDSSMELADTYNLGVKTTPEIEKREPSSNSTSSKEASEHYQSPGLEGRETSGKAFS